MLAVIRLQAALLIASLGLTPAVVLWSSSGPAGDQATFVGPEERERAEYGRLSFKLLAGFPISTGSVPAPILALDGHKAAVDGYMLPLEMSAAGVSRFLLTANVDTCLFGVISPPNARIEVMMRESHRVPYTHLPLRAYGALSVQPQVESGWLAGLYWMAADFVGIVPR
jgi:hypothetical protein